MALQHPVPDKHLQHIGDELWVTQRQRHSRAQFGRKDGGFAHDTGEGSISPYHREHGGETLLRGRLRGGGLRRRLRRRGRRGAGDGLCDAALDLDHALVAVLVHDDHALLGERRAREARETEREDRSVTHR